MDLFIIIIYFKLFIQIIYSLLLIFYIYKVLRFLLHSHTEAI